MNNLSAVFNQMEQLHSSQLQASLGVSPPRPTEQQLDIWRGFESHAARRCVRPFPAFPALVADFLGTISDEALEATCQAIQVVHDALGASSPVSSLAVRTILERRLRTECPRSWTKEDRIAFAAVPPEIRAILLRRETERDTALRRAQNQLAQERKRLEANTTKPEEKAEDNNARIHEK